MYNLVHAPLLALVCQPLSSFFLPRASRPRWSFGAVLYVLLTGCKPFCSPEAEAAGEDPSLVLYRIMNPRWGKKKRGRGGGAKLGWGWLLGCVGDIVALRFLLLHRSDAHNPHRGLQSLFVWAAV